MKRIKSKPSVALSFMSALLPGLLIGLVGLTGNDVLVKDAQAVVCPPASPGSVAGVHRRGRRQKENQDGLIPYIIEQEENSKEYRKNWAKLIQKIYEVDPLACPVE